MDPWEGFSQGFSNSFENEKERKLKAMMAMQLSPYQAGALQNDQAALALQQAKLNNPEPTTAMQNYQFLVSKGVSPKEAALAAFATPYTQTPSFDSFNTPPPVNNLGAPQPAPTPLTKEQMLQDYFKKQGKNVLNMQNIFKKPTP